MKFFTVLFIFANFMVYDSPTLVEIRNLYEQASSDKAVNLKLNTILAYVKKDNSVLEGYRGAGIMIEANHVFNPLTKLSRFRKGKGIIERAILSDPNNIELRYIRLTIQTNIPKFLGYHDEIKTDKGFIIKKMPMVKDLDLTNRMADYLSSSKICTVEEIKQLQQWKSK